MKDVSDDFLIIFDKEYFHRRETSNVRICNFSGNNVELYLDCETCSLNLDPDHCGFKGLEVDVDNYETSRFGIVEIISETLLNYIY